MSETTPGIYDVIGAKPTDDGRLFVQLSKRPPVIAEELVLGLDDHSLAEGAMARVFEGRRAEILPASSSTPVPVRVAEIGYTYPECESCGRDDTEVIVYDPGRDYWPEHEGHVWRYECEHCGRPMPDD